MLRFLGAVLLTPGTPKKLNVVFPNEKGKSFNALIVSQKRVNVGFVYVGDFAMAGEATASITIPPSTASSVPFANISLGPSGANPLTLDSFAIDGSAAETVQVSVLVT